MSTVTHVIPHSFAADRGQIINIVTPSVAIAQSAQDGEVAQISEQVTLVQPVFTPSIVQTVQQGQADVIEKDKQSIYKHPMFPLMALMFEKCEQASSVSDMPSPESIVEDIQVFLLHKDKEQKSLLSGDSELDNLMLRAIQVLRIHLLELEKVNDLCKDFCQRYTNCLKGKLQSENLLRTESDYDQSMFDEPPKEESIQSVTPMVTASTAAGVILQQPFQTSVPTVPALGPGQIMSGGTIYQMVQTPQGLVAQPLQLQPTVSTIGTQIIHGGTPLSQIGVPVPTVQTSSASNNSTTPTLGSMSSGFDSDDDDSLGKKKNKRGVLPKSATQIMKSWLFQHIVHPYPTEDEKRQIAAQTHLTLLQVNNWFINARRRILQPMLDAGNPEPVKSKKVKVQSRPPQRFWPFGSGQNSSPLTSIAASSLGVSASSAAGIDVNSGQTIVIPTQNKAIVLPPGTVLSPDGQIWNLSTGSETAVLSNIKHSSSDTDEPKDTSDTNNNSHNTDSNDNEDSSNHSHPEDSKSQNKMGSE